MQKRVSPLTARESYEQVRHILNKQTNSKSLKPELISKKKYFQSKTECKIRIIQTQIVLMERQTKKRVQNIVWGIINWQARERIRKKIITLIDKGATKDIWQQRDLRGRERWSKKRSKILNSIRWAKRNCHQKHKHTQRTVLTQVKSKISLDI